MKRGVSAAGYTPLAIRSYPKRNTLHGYENAAGGPPHVEHSIRLNISEHRGLSRHRVNLALYTVQSRICTHTISS